MTMLEGKPLKGLGTVRSKQFLDDSLLKVMPYVTQKGFPLDLEPDLEGDLLSSYFHPPVPDFNFMNRQPGILPKLFRNEELLVFKKCLWYIFCNVNILIANWIIMPLSSNQITFHLPLQIYSLMFSSWPSGPGN